jgi:hypothetical protein
MHMLLRRYNRAGAARPWFYAAAAAGFGTLFVWAAIAGDWLVAALALLMAPVTVAGAWLVRHAAATLELEDDHGE